MSTVSIGMGEGCLYTYRGSGEVERHPYPEVVFDANLNYNKLYSQAESYVAAALAGATRLVTSNVYGFGMRNDGEIVVPKAGVTGFTTVGTDKLEELIIKFVNKTSTTVPSLVIMNKDIKWYCMRTGILNKTSEVSTKGDVKHMLASGTKNVSGAQTAYALWYTSMGIPAPLTP